MDAVGNRLTQTGPGGPTNYTYDANNRLIQAGSATYSYDANGNVTNISSGRTFTWDVFNRMTSTTASGTTVTYTYNGDGLKTRRVGPNGTTNYYHDGFRHIWETDSAGAMTARLLTGTSSEIFCLAWSPPAYVDYYRFDGIGIHHRAHRARAERSQGALLCDCMGQCPRAGRGTRPRQLPICRSGTGHISLPSITWGCGSMIQVSGGG